jgi:glucose/arabinose dehydrogenase
VASDDGSRPRRAPPIPGRRELLAAGLAAALVAVSAAAAGRDAAVLSPAPALKPCCGLVAEVYATGLKRPTALDFGPDGLLYATQETGEVVAVGRGSTRPRVLARGFATPLGLTWVGPTLYVSAQGYVSRLSVRNGRVVSRRKIVTKLPFDRHQQDTIVRGPDGRLYLGSGSTCDVCKEQDSRSGAILSFRQDGSDLRVVARGLRNPFGLVFAGPTLYVSDNARDDLGEEEPAETIVRFRSGADYGWPRCWGSWRLRTLQGSCRGVTAPFAYLEPHSSANTLALWAGTLVVAEWGQYLSERWGRKLVRVNIRTGRSSIFADGFDHPLGLAPEPRGGGLLAGDWGRGVVYRIRKR